MTVTDTLVDAGVERERIDYVKSQLETTTHHVFDEYDVELTDADHVVDLVQETILSMVIEHGNEIEDSSILERFELLVDDVDTPTSSPAISDVVLSLGAMDGDSSIDTPEPVQTLRHAIIADNRKQQ